MFYLKLSDFPRKIKSPEICRLNKIYLNFMHYGSDKCNHMKLKDNNLRCPYNVALSEMNGNSTITKKQKRINKTEFCKLKQSCDCQLPGKARAHHYLILQLQNI